MPLPPVFAPRGEPAELLSSALLAGLSPAASAVPGLGGRCAGPVVPPIPRSARGLASRFNFNTFQVHVPLRFASWNSQALINALSVDQRRANLKLGLLKKLMSKVDVIAVQETHGDAGDSAALSRIFPGWCFEESSSVGTVGGGTLFAIRKTFKERFTLVTHTTIVPGRVHALALVEGSGQQVVFVNLHISPSLSHPEVKHLFKSIASYVHNHSARSAVFIMGDFNYLETDESRYHVSTGNFSRDSNTLPSMFNDAFPDFTELAQPDFTRAGSLRDAGLEVFSRIDRIYCSIPPSQLLDCDLAAGVWASTTASFKISDHRPVLVSISPKVRRGGRPPRIPEWIAKHELFAGEVFATLFDNPFGTHPGNNLLHLKEILHMAAIKVKGIVQEKPADTLDEKLHWAISLVRATREADVPSMQKAVDRCIELAAALDIPGQILSIDPLRAHRLVEGLSRQVSERALAGAHLANSDVSRCEVLQQQAAAWRKAGRRLSLNSVRDMEGNIILDPLEAASYLRHYWQEVFSKRDIDEDLAALAIAHTTPFSSTHCWDIKVESILHIVSAGKSSSPGPDGIPYSAYKAIKEIAATTLFDAFQYYHRGAPLPPHFNESRLVFIPKGEEAHNDIDGSTARSPANTRPITLSNTDNKVFAAAINHVLAGATAEVIGPYQQGFIKGRSIVHQVVALDGYASLWARFFPKDLAVILFDIIAAFPSLSHMFIFMTLVHRGLPPALVEFIRKLYDDVFSSFTVGDAPAMFIRIMAGIKQGCPLSATMFALAFDGCIAMIQHSSIRNCIKYLAYADDFATIVRDIWKNILALLNIIQQFDRIANLRISWKKTVVIPLYVTTIQNIRSRLIAMFPLIAAATFAFSGKYLGVHFGPGAECREWHETAVKIRRNALTLKLLAYGITSTMRWYNLAVASVASHVGQLVAPSGTMLRAEAAALAVATAGPCGALPIWVLGALKKLGFSQQFSSIACVSAAARFRVTLATPIFHELVRLHAEAPFNDDSLFAPPMRHWIEHSLFAKLQLHHAAMSAIPKLRGAASETRIQRFILDKMSEDPAILRCLPQFAAFNALRTIANAWPTSARVAQAERPCLFGCGGIDSLLHYCCCPVIISVSKALVPMAEAHLNDPLFLLCLFPFNSAKDSDKPLVFAAGLLADAAFSARSEAAHSGRPVCIRSSFIGRFKQIARASDKARARILRVCGSLGRELL